MRRLKQYGSELIFEYDLRNTDIEAMFKKGSFLSDILSSWNKIKIKKLNENEEVGSKVIWNNSGLRIANKPYFYQSWFDRGFKCLKDIYNNTTKRFYSFIELVDKYNIPASDFLKYMSLISSIPMSLKNALNNDNDINSDSAVKADILTKLLKTKEANKFLYKYQSNNEKLNEITSQEKWASYFETENLKWDTIYSNVFTSTIDTKLRNFQYKYLFRIIPTNKRLFTQNIANSNLCDFCNMDIETVQHLFWECNKVQIFWNNFHKFINNTNIQMQITYKTISFGWCEETFEDKLKNFIIFYAKYYIFLNKCHKTIPSCDLFKHYLGKQIKIEKEIALMNDKLYTFELKWRQFIAYL